MDIEFKHVLFYKVRINNRLKVLQNEIKPVKNQVNPIHN